MEIPESSFTAATVGLLVLLTVSLLVARIVSPAERRLATSIGVLLAGIFFIAQPAAGAPALAVGTALWAVGLLGFVRDALRWNRRNASPFGPLALPFLLPPAFFGAVLAGGLLISLILAAVA